mgnify:CR=1 FL=1
MSGNVISSLESLPTDGLTVTALRSLDFVVPGEWDNVVSFDKLVAQVTGSDSAKLAAAVRERASALELADPAYGRALKVYQLVDSVDQVAAAAAAVGKVKDLFGGFGGFLDKFTPKPETTQSLDAGAKLVAELIAFSQLNGMPTNTEAIGRFVVALSDYGKYDLMRMSAWVVFDGLLPLGPDFVRIISATFSDLAGSALAENGAMSSLMGQIPGDSSDAKRAFVVSAIDQTGEWINGFVAEKGLTQDKVMGQLKGTLSIAEGSMDVVAAAIDASTMYTAHTGTQTVARALARKAVEELKGEVWERYVAGL